MFFVSYLDKMAQNPKHKKFAGSESTFAPAYDYWLNFLMEKAIGRFNYENLPETLPAHEIELALQTSGTCGITDKFNNTIYVFNGYWGGEPTVYYDTYKKYSVFSPLYANVLEVGTEVIVGRNNDLQTPTYYIAHRYAMQLAHIEVSLYNLLINGRDSEGIPMVQDEAQRQAMEAYRNNLCNGILKPVQDLNTFSPIEFKGISRSIGYSLQEIIEAKENILNEFYNVLGIRTVWNKKGNMIADEIGGNDTMLEQNLNRLLECRKKFIDEVNSRFGLNITVELSEYLKYKKEVLEYGKSEPIPNDSINE